MPTLIKGNEIAQNTYVRIDAVDGHLSLPMQDVLVGLSTWQQHREQLLAHPLRKAVFLEPDQFAESLAEDCQKLDMIAINFPAFADGRGYSTAYLLRTRYGFTGELRAMGDVFKDTLFYQRRVGFDAHVLPDDRDALVAIKGLEDFAETYQYSADNKASVYATRRNA
jgi:uncharacterized protein (DUF934 family)